ncbi:hypothetical protein [uncultured Legionella sp.]|uniref:hypothetical protein n=1 Tax=uncultured Legionella sp. TaxID=210934 RepID=UPI002606071E|nr:hypothetical protein [uncultured Legionella sp.]
MQLKKKSRTITRLELNLLLLRSLENDPFLNLHVREITSILKLIATLPIQKQKVLERIMEPKVFVHFIGNGFTLPLLNKTYPECESQFFNLLYDNIDQMINYPLSFSIVVKSFPNYKEKLYQLIRQPDFFEKIVKDKGGVKWIQASFPEKEIFKNTYEKVRLLVKHNSPGQKAYTRGACIGMFRQLNVSSEIGELIGKHLDSASGLNVTLTCKEAYLTAQEERNRLNQIR